MASNGKWVVTLNSAGIKEVLKSQEVKSALNDVANKTLNAAGEGFKAKPYTGKNRAGVIVAPETAEAYYKNLRNNTLLKALRGK